MRKLGHQLRCLVLCLMAGLMVAFAPNRSEAVVMTLPDWLARDMLLVPLSAADIAVNAACMSPNPAVYGVTVGTVYCVQKFVSMAVRRYGANISSSSLIKSIVALSFMIAATLLGVRFMTMQSDHIARDTILVLLKACVVYYLIANSAALYDTLTRAIGEGISWVIAGLGPLTTVPDACVVLEIPKQYLVGVATAIDPSFNYAEYSVWHIIDCMLLRIFGITFAVPFSMINLGGGVTINMTGIMNTANVALTNLGFNLDLSSGAMPSVTAASMVIVLMLGMSTGIIGLIVLGLGITALASVMKMILKAVFTVLMSYVLLGTMAVLVPLFAPLLLFQSHTDESYTRAIFDRCVNIVIGAVMQPICVVGFLCFAVVCIDSFIEGEVSPIPEVKAVYTSNVAPNRACKPGYQPDNPADPPSGPCTFQQLFPTMTGILLGPSFAMVGNYSYETDAGQSLFTWRQVADPNTLSSDCNFMNRKATFLAQNVIEIMNQMESKSVGVQIPGPDKIKVSYLILVQFGSVLIGLLLMAMVLSQIMNSIPQMIQYIFHAAGAGVIAAASAPLEGLIDNTKDGMLRGIAQGKDAQSVLGKLSSKTMGGLEGAAKGLLNSLGRRR